MRATLTFTRPDDVVPDEERPGLLRANPIWEDEDGGDVRRCELHDLAAEGTAEPGLEGAGFETVDLSVNLALRHALDAVRAQDRLTDSSAAGIRESLAGARLHLSSGRSLKIEFVVDDGLFHRRAGPNGLDVNPGGIDRANGHSAAVYVHGDQDVYGTPLRQEMDGAAPDVFRHVTPDGRNEESDTLLLNLWIPLHAPVQPLALMDRRTLDAPRHQLRYGLPVDGFLERDDDAGVNDIWSFLYDEGQGWYVRSHMTSDQGYVFDTLGTAHGAAVLPGEPAVEALFVALARACEAVDRGDRDALRSISIDPAAADLPDDAPPAVRQAWERMSALVEQAESHDDAHAWCVAARAAIDAAIRRSVEMRLVATLVSE